MKFNKKKFALEYERRLSGEGYPGNLLNIIIDEVKDAETIIDLGAGTGFYSIPLAKKGYSIIAVEPSYEMLKILKGKIDDKLSPFISLHNVDWESWQGDWADILISVHSIYGISSTKEAIKKMQNYSGKTILIIKANSESRTLSALIKNRLNINRCSSNFTSKVLIALDDLKINFSSREIEQKRESVFFDLFKEAEYYCYHLDVERGKIDLVRSIIEENSENHGDRYIFKALYRDLLITF